MHCASTTALLAGVVDYAGLFPPAGLSMSAAAAEYLAAGSGAHAWMLGRLVVPASRLQELADVLAASSAARPEWHISAIVRDRSDADVAAIAAFNAQAARHVARVDAVESKPQALDGIEWLAAQCPGLDVYVEVTPVAGADQWLSRVAACGLRAKVRTGGVTADAFPRPDVLAGFLAAAVRRGVVFKATAGLHHAIRGNYRLTYEAGAPLAPMYGYLNVLLATAVLVAGRPVATAEALLTQTDQTSLALTDDSVRWGVDGFPVLLLHETRTRHLASVGSCSFREPVEELDALESH